MFSLPFRTQVVRKVTLLQSCNRTTDSKKCRVWPKLMLSALQNQVRTSCWLPCLSKQCHSCATIRIWTSPRFMNSHAPTSTLSSTLQSRIKNALGSVLGRGRMKPMAIVEKEKPISASLPLRPQILRRQILQYHYLQYG